VVGGVVSDIQLEPNKANQFFEWMEMIEQFPSKDLVHPPI